MSSSVAYKYITNLTEIFLKKLLFLEVCLKLNGTLYTWDF